MGVTTTNLEDLYDSIGNIYEAIMIVAKRARQINEEQKMMLETEFGITGDNDGYEDDQDEVEKNDDITYMKLPKPTRVALEELLSGKLDYEYLNKDEE